MRQETQRRRQAQEQARRQDRMRQQQNEKAKKERQRKQREMIEKSRATQGRMVKIPNMEHFKEAMLDPSGKVYKTHCLIMFVGNKNAERKGEEELFFPYPFAGEVGKDSTYYKGTLQIAKASIILSRINSSYVLLTFSHHIHFSL